MEQLLQRTLTPKSSFSYATPPCVARYTPVFWEPLPGTGERIVALLALEPHESSQQVLSAGTHLILPAERLRAMLGRQRGNSAHGVLRETATFMTERQQAGMPVDELKPPFHGFTMGPTMVARGFTIEQLLDAAVRSISAFGTADDLVNEEAAKETPRHTVRTAEFLKSVRRIATSDNPDLKPRFDKKIETPGNLTDWTVDYAFKQWMVQATSLPVTVKQAINTQKEAQSKMFELEQIRKLMQGNSSSPVLLVNIEALTHSGLDQEARDEAERMLERLVMLSQNNNMGLIQAQSPQEAASRVLELA